MFAVANISAGKLVMLDEAGYNVGPMPDKVWVLHPLYERADGQPFDDGLRREIDAHGNVLVFDDRAVLPPDPPKRTVRWDDYAQRRGIPMLRPGGRPGGQDALPGVGDDDFVELPDEGRVEDLATRQALFDILLDRSERGPATACTAYYYRFHAGAGRPLEMPWPPNVLRGPLGAWQELFDRPGYAEPPQNIWPDDHQWVVQTHVDSWGTAISGPTSIIEDLIACLTSKRSGCLTLAEAHSVRACSSTTRSTYGCR